MIGRMARLLFALVMVVVMLSSALANEPRGFSTKFQFSVLGAKMYSTDSQPDSVALGSSDGWTCTASAITSDEGPQAPGAVKTPVYKNAQISCVDVSGATATIGVSCDVASAQRSERSMGLKSARAKTIFPVVVSIGCFTK
jgi:hypothetical protein